MFITFYSYKGGVGRTLALANVAYLLATDEEDPCRVLLWDFDLEAPGLQHIFECQWGDRPRGFVDYVHEYLTKAEIPEVADYIHTTDVPGVDLLPAGQITAEYSLKLEKINWRDLYDERRGYDFINKLREDIGALRDERGHPLYDYVLIDSRTGYSDVGGICVRQLPDAVVLMFRLNDQNISGISKVNEAVEAFANESEGREIEVVPVVSPAWPFASEEAAAPFAAAKEAFGGRDLLSITFDSSLTFGEKVIVREQASYPMPLRICSDYERLTGQLRPLNDLDTVTMWRQARDAFRHGDMLAAFQRSSRLVGRRPDRRAYWEGLTDIIGTMARRNMKDGLDHVLAFLDAWLREHPSHGHALLARARYHGVVEDAAAALADYDRAIAIADDPMPSLLERADFAMRNERLEEAEVGLRSALGHDPDHPPALALLGDLLARAGDVPASIEAYTRSFTGGFENASVLWNATHLAFRHGDFQGALTLLDTPAAEGIVAEMRGLCRVHSLAALGDIEEARSQLQQVEASPHQSEVNMTEAHIAVGNLDVAEARVAEALSAEALSAEGGDAKPDWIMLGAIIAVLNGDTAGATQTVERMLSTGDLPQPDWSYMELLVIVDTAAAKGQLTGDVADLVRSWLARLEEASPPPPRATMTGLPGGWAVSPSYVWDA